MSKPPAVQFYAGDFLTGTTLMTNEEVGLYIRLLCLQVENGSVPDDPERMALVYGPQVPKLWPAVRAKFVAGPEPGTMVNVKMGKVLEDRAAYRLKQSEKGKASAEARSNSGSKNIQPRSNHGSTVVEPLGGRGRGNTQKGKERATPTDRIAIAFDGLWVKYERYGSKAKALAYWRKLPEEDRADVLAKVEEYVQSTPGCEYRMNLEGWINPAERRWERPIVKRTNGAKPKTIADMTGAEAREEIAKIRAKRGIAPDAFLPAEYIPTELWAASRRP